MRSRLPHPRRPTARTSAHDTPGHSLWITSPHAGADVHPSLQRDPANPGSIDEAKGRPAHEAQHPGLFQNPLANTGLAGPTDEHIGSRVPVTAQGFERALAVSFVLSLLTCAPAVIDIGNRPSSAGPVLDRETQHGVCGPRRAPCTESNGAQTTVYRLLCIKAQGAEGTLDVQ